MIILIIMMMGMGGREKKLTIDPYYLTCEFCMFAMDEVHKALEYNFTVDVLEDFMVGMCTLMEIESYDMCKMAVAAYAPEVMLVLDTRFVTPQEVCNHFLFCNVSTTVDRDGMVEQTYAERKKTFKREKEEEEVLDTGYFVQFSDVHVDARYVPQTNTKCGTPLCCQAEYGPGDAGKFGNYACDIPELVLLSALEFVASARSTPPVDFLIFTGDNPPHNIWNQSRSQNLAASAAWAEDTRAAFPSSFPVYPAMGNHESYPCDQFEANHTYWLYDALAQDWASWLDASAQAQVRTGGYYTALIRPGLRLISLNTMFCDLINFWLILNVSDPTGQLAFLSQTLAAAQDAGERVYLTGHIPWGNTGCLDDYAHEIELLVLKYADIIAGQFYGHTHHDSFQVWSTPAKIPAQLGFVCPSLTTFTNINPSFRIYHYDRSTGNVLNYYQYQMNLTLANEKGAIDWYLYYDAKETYGLVDMSPSSFYALAESMKTNQTLFDLYYTHFYTGGPHASEPCDAKCVKSNICLCQNGTPRKTVECTGQSYSLMNIWIDFMNEVC